MTTTSPSRKRSALSFPHATLRRLKFVQPITLSRRYDKQLLPKAMQLRRGEFGKKGQVACPSVQLQMSEGCKLFRCTSNACFARAEVKHSHLTDVDTTDMSAAWAQSSKIVQRSAPRKCGNMFSAALHGFVASGTRRRWQLLRVSQTSSDHP